jgi:two-component sensor histidine kinase/CHASE3 domain sensor protein
MPISTRFVVNSTIVLLTIGFLSLLGIVLTTIWLGEKAQLYFEEATQLRDTRVAAVELRAALQNAESSQRGYLVGGNEIYLAPYDTAKRQALLHLDRLSRSDALPAATQPVLRRLGSIVSEKITEMDGTIELKRAFRDADAFASFRSNRGKALMDEANVFLSSMIRGTDERLTSGTDEQQRNARWLRLVSVVGGLVIVLVVGGIVLTVFKYAREVAQARDELQSLNATLEHRVEERTRDLVAARDKAEVLVAEVNHRVANSLSMVAALVQMQSNAMTDMVAKAALRETRARIDAIASVHQRLYTSGDARVVALDEYLTSLLKSVETSMRNEGHGASLDYKIESLSLKTDSAVHLGIIITEWVTNAFKYAYPERAGEVRVRLKRLTEDQGELLVEDDGIGRKEDSPIHGSGLGTRIVSAMSRTIGGKVEYLVRDPGTSARLEFPLTA